MRRHSQMVRQPNDDAVSSTIDWREIAISYPLTAQAHLELELAEGLKGFLPTLAWTDEPSKLAELGVMKICQPVVKCHGNALGTLPRATHARVRSRRRKA